MREVNDAIDEDNRQDLYCEGGEDPVPSITRFSGGSLERDRGGSQSYDQAHRCTVATRQKPTGR